MWQGMLGMFCCRGGIRKILWDVTQSILLHKITQGSMFSRKREKGVYVGNSPTFLLFHRTHSHLCIQKTFLIHLYKRCRSLFKRTIWDFSGLWYFSRHWWRTFQMTWPRRSSRKCVCLTCLTRRIFVSMGALSLKKQFMQDFSLRLFFSWKREWQDWLWYVQFTAQQVSSTPLTCLDAERCVEIDHHVLSKKERKIRLVDLPSYLCVVCTELLFNRQTGTLFKSSS